MSTIWKFELAPPPCILPIPTGGLFLAVGEQHGELVGWFSVDPDRPTERRHIHAVPTGGTVPHCAAKYLGTASYVGTVQMVGGLVFHVYDAGVAS